MTWLIGDRERDGWLITQSADPPRTPLDEYRARTGIRLAHDFRGDSLTAGISGQLLTAVNGPTFDEDVADTLDGNPLLSDPFSLLVSHSFSLFATNHRFETSSPTAVDFGTGSFLVHWTGRFPDPAGVCDLFGNRDGSSEGFEVQFDQGAQKVQALAQPVGQGLDGAEFVESIGTDEWVDIVVIADRAAGLWKLGTILNETSTALSPGTLTSADPLQIGAVNGLACVAEVMALRVAFGTQVEGRSPTQLARAIAKTIWLEPDDRRVSTPFK
jgi:hypothetical protein